MVKPVYPPLSSCETEAERKELVERVMNDGHSYTKAAVALGLEKYNRGVIAGICRRHGIASKNLPLFVRPSIAQTPELAEHPSGVLRPQKPRYKLVPEHEACEYRDENDKQCSFEPLSGTKPRRCSLHKGKPNAKPKPR